MKALPYFLGLAAFAAILALALLLATSGIGRRPAENAVTASLLLQRYSELGLAAWLWLTMLLLRMQYTLRAAAVRHTRILLLLLIGDGVGNAACAASVYGSRVDSAGRVLIVASVIAASVMWARTKGDEGSPKEPPSA